MRKTLKYDVHLSGACWLVATLGVIDGDLVIPLGDPQCQCFEVFSLGPFSFSRKGSHILGVVGGRGRGVWVLVFREGGWGSQPVYGLPLGPSVLTGTWLPTFHCAHFLPLEYLPPLNLQSPARWVRS